MNQRLVVLFLACLLLSGFTPCINEIARNPDQGLQNYSTAQRNSERRAKALQRECDELKARPITFDEEHAFGGAVSVTWVSQGEGLIEGSEADALHMQLNKIGKNLAAQSSRPHLPWTFGVLKSQGVNAVSGPGGFVFVSEGLLAQVDNESQLAGVLAHEIAHITGKHALNEYHQYLVDQCELSVKGEFLRVEREQLAAGVADQVHRIQDRVEGHLDSIGHTLPIGGAAIRQLSDALNSVELDKAGLALLHNVTSGVVKRLTERGFRAEDEYAADLEAMELMGNAGYAPEEYLAFLDKLPEKGLSTAHPDKVERRARVRKHLGVLRRQDASMGFAPSSVLHGRVVPLTAPLRKQEQPSAAATP
jgi:predicted Zn-dependent protease